MKQRNPLHHRADRDYSEMEIPTRDTEKLRSDNPAWEQRVRPLIAFLSGGGKSLDEIKAWARAERHMVSVQEEALYWLLARGRVERVRRVWRLVRHV